MLVFIPLTAGELRGWAAGAPFTPDRAFAATSSFLSAFGLAGAEDEDAERTLLHIAALDALLRGRVRLVAVVDAPGTGRDDEFGAVEVAQVGYERVQALFADSPDAAATVARAASALTGQELETAWEAPAHEGLMEEADLLWFGPQEWGRVLAGLPV